MPTLGFARTAVAEFPNPLEPGPMNTFHTVADVNGDGRPDIVISGRNGEMAWFENPGSRTALPWRKHLIGAAQGMECGGSAVDLTGSGLPDVINGSDWSSDCVFWWENPGAETGDAVANDAGWVRRLITKTSKGQIHDTIVGDATGDGRLSLVFTNQSGGTRVTVIPLPTDPTQSPWPDQMIAADGLFEVNPGNQGYNGRQPEEGLAIGDIDGDGRNELIAGTHWLKYDAESGTWACHKFASGYITTKCLVADVDGDGMNEIVLSEGDPFVYGKSEGGKLAWFRAGADIEGLWEEHVLDEGLIDAHTLQAADLFRTGRMDLVVGEVGKSNDRVEYLMRPPVLAVYRNLGGGRFEKQVIDRGTGIHEGLLVDMDGDGHLDIVGKPLHGPGIWDIHVYYNDGTLVPG